MMILSTAWENCFNDLGGSKPPSCIFEELQARYSEPHRAYHTLQHLQECFAWFNETRSLMRAPGNVAFALFYHDAIYDTHASNNEARSAALARTILEEYVRCDNDFDAIETLILATRHDVVAQPGDAQLLVDIDLSILGAPPFRFDEYERQVRREYDWVSEDIFRSARTRILGEFVKRPALYNTTFFRERLETQARANLARSVQALTI